MCTRFEKSCSNGTKLMEFLRCLLIFQDTLVHIMLSDILSTDMTPSVASTVRDHLAIQYPNKLEVYQNVT